MGKGLIPCARRCGWLASGTASESGNAPQSIARRSEKDFAAVCSAGFDSWCADAEATAARPTEIPTAPLVRYRSTNALYGFLLIVTSRNALAARRRFSRACAYLQVTTLGRIRSENKGPKICHPRHHCRGPSSRDRDLLRRSQCRLGKRAASRAPSAARAFLASPADEAATPS